MGRKRGQLATGGWGGAIERGRGAARQAGCGAARAWMWRVGASRCTRCAGATEAAAAEAGWCWGSGAAGGAAMDAAAVASSGGWRDASPPAVRRCDAWLRRVCASESAWGCGCACGCACVGAGVAAVMPLETVGTGQLALLNTLGGAAAVLWSAGHARMQNWGADGRDREERVRRQNQEHLDALRLQMEDQRIRKRRDRFGPQEPKLLAAGAARLQRDPAEIADDIGYVQPGKGPSPRALPAVGQPNGPPAGARLQSPPEIGRRRRLEQAPQPPLPPQGPDQQLGAAPGPPPVLPPLRAPYQDPRQLAQQQQLQQLQQLQSVDALRAEVAQVAFVAQVALQAAATRPAAAAAARPIAAASPTAAVANTTAADLDVATTATPNPAAAAVHPVAAAATACTVAAPATPPRKGRTPQSPRTTGKRRRTTKRPFPCAPTHQIFSHSHTPTGDALRCDGGCGRPFDEDETRCCACHAQPVARRPRPSLKSPVHRHTG